jgi:hypothetical protein
MDKIFKNSVHGIYLVVDVLINFENKFWEVIDMD